MPSAPDNAPVFVTEKRPRAYASEILSIRDKAERIAALELVPEYWRDWVRGYVEGAYSLAAARRTERGRS